ncbi:hypothetical protein HYS47_04415 [Candidatus Woesearchaeota archaeon]|nr:hypothetical protein [Candidatus Woesearchaeota archaeon]
MDHTYKIVTSFTEQTARSQTPLEQLVLNVVANHLPADSGGGRIAVLLEQDGRFVPLLEADPSQQTTSILFEDDGLGYDVRWLSVEASSKLSSGQNVGQFGRGLKEAAAAAIRAGIDMEYQSRDWRAKPYAQEETIDYQLLRRLGFEVTVNGQRRRGSRTVFPNPPPTLVEEVFQLPMKALAFNQDCKVRHAMTHPDIYNYEDVVRLYRLQANRGYASRIVEAGPIPPSVYIKGMRVKPVDAICSYDLGIEEIIIERNDADRKKMLKEIGVLLKTCSSQGVIRQILLEAQRDPEKKYLEFEALQQLNEESSDQEQVAQKDYAAFKEITRYGLRTFFDANQLKSNRWAAVFSQVFRDGDKLPILASDDTNSNNDAVHDGYIPIHLPNSVRRYLIDRGVPTVKNLERQKEYRWVSLDDLTAEERDVLGLARRITEIVCPDPAQRPTYELRVYSGVFTQQGRELESNLGLTEKKEGGHYISIKRSQLADRKGFIRTFFHELGHVITDVGDFDRRFADFFVMFGAEKIDEQLAQTKTQERSGMKHLWRRIAGLWGK